MAELAGLPTSWRELPSSLAKLKNNIGLFPILVRCLNLCDSLEVVGAIFSGRIVQDTKSDSDVSALSSLSVLIHKVRLLKVLTPALSPASLAPLLSLVSTCSLLVKSCSARSVAAMGASISLASVKGRGLESLVKLGKVQRELPGLSVTRGELSEVIIIREEIPGQDGGGEGHDSQEETHDAGMGVRDALCTWPGPNDIYTTSGPAHGEE